MHLTALHRVQNSVDPLLLLNAVTSRDAVQVPLRSQRVLLWEVELEDGIIVRHHRHFASAACKCSMPLSGCEKATALNAQDMSNIDFWFAQVPPPSQRVLPWEVELEDGTIMSTIKEDASGEGILSLTLGALGRLVLRAVTGIARKVHLL